MNFVIRQEMISCDVADHDRNLHDRTGHQRETNTFAILQTEDIIIRIWVTEYNLTFHKNGL